MREELVNIVYPALEQGIDLLQRLRRGYTLDFAKEQANLRRLLLTGDAAKRWPAFGGDGDSFLGIRYALACWLDEIFILGTPWSSQWESRSFEESLFSSRDRAHQFWSQARLAAAQPDADGLEAFYLCVMLGFRGIYRENLPLFQEWRATTESQLQLGAAHEWPDKPAELKPETNVPPLRGRENLRGVILCFAAIIGIIIPLITFSIIFFLQT